MSYAALDQDLAPLGLTLRGGFVSDGQTFLLIGNVASTVWPVFQTTQWQEPDPLDHWIKQVLSPLAPHWHAEVKFTCDGPPFIPIQTWAQRADSVFPSPIGPLIHPTFGLWHAYRAVFILDHTDWDLPDKPDLASPCESCTDTPCVRACPQNVFADEGYNLSACLTELKTEGNACLSGGCKSRNACPVGTAYRYHPDHARFHMERFLDAFGLDFTG